VNSRSHARLRRIQLVRKCARVQRALIEYIYTKNRRMFDAMVADMALGIPGTWSLDEEGLLTYKRAIFNTSV
jgi:hypothetical protein